jgi:hypothetical protein
VRYRNNGDQLSDRVNRNKGIMVIDRATGDIDLRYRMVEKTSSYYTKYTVYLSLLDVPCTFTKHSLIYPICVVRYSQVPLNLLSPSSYVSKARSILSHRFYSDAVRPLQSHCTVIMYT